MDKDIKKHYKATYRQFYPGYTDEQIESLMAKREEKRRSVISGPDVIHLDYFGGLIDGSELEEIKQVLSEIDIRLSSYDKTGDVHASLQDLSLQVSLWLKDPVVSSIVGGLGVNIVWEGIKQVTLTIWQKFKARAIQANSNQPSMNFGLHMQVNAHTAIDLKLDGKFTEHTVLAALDKIPALIKEQGELFKPEDINFLVFDPETGTWSKVDTMAEFHRLATEQREKRNLNEQ